MGKDTSDARKKVFECECGTFSHQDDVIFLAMVGTNPFNELHWWNGLRIRLSAGGIPYIEYSWETDCGDLVTRLIIPTRWEVFEPSYMSELGFQTQWHKWIYVPDLYASEEGQRPCQNVNRPTPSNYPGVPFIKTKLVSLGAKLYQPQSPDEQKTELFGFTFSDENDRFWDYNGQMC